MPTYMAHYETACMTRQHLEGLVRDVTHAGGPCRSDRLYMSLTNGHLVWLFAAPDRETLEAWLSGLRMGNFEWLARVEYEAGDAGVRDV